MCVKDLRIQSSGGHLPVILEIAGSRKLNCELVHVINKRDKCSSLLVFPTTINGGSFCTGSNSPGAVCISGMPLLRTFMFVRTSQKDVQVSKQNIFSSMA